jgi:hypothetical protein
MPRSRDSELLGTESASGWSPWSRIETPSDRTQWNRLVIALFWTPQSRTENTVQGLPSMQRTLLISRIRSRN